MTAYRPVIDRWAPPIAATRTTRRRRAAALLDK